ncbi:MAG TPA: 50S ribosomal protein L9 [Candidatus Cloacimonadota bacterium]|nr:50S ribosomal protein L9 [Candidatus Cloacimonadota bacterium]
MKVILLESIEKLGSKGEVVNVRRGFARNFLIPRNSAIYATPLNMKKLSSIQASFAEAEQKKLAELKVLAEKIASAKVVLARKVDENEHMFGSVSELDIVNALHEQGIEIHKAALVMEKHLKELGEFKLAVKLHKEVSAELTVLVEKEAE